MTKRMPMVFAVSDDKGNVGNYALTGFKTAKEAKQALQAIRSYDSLLAIVKQAKTLIEKLDRPAFNRLVAAIAQVEDML